METRQNKGYLVMINDVARQLTAGQRAAVREMQKRRGELDLTQRKLAEVSGVSEATIQNIEAGRSWPRSGTLAKLERLGLGWPVGYMTDLAAKEDEQSESGRGETRDEAVARLQEVERSLRSELDRTMTELEQLRNGDRDHARRRSDQHTG